MNNEDDKREKEGVESGPRWLYPGALPPGYTIDTIRWHRKKRPPAGLTPADNLALPTGSMKNHISEYTRRYRPFRYGPPCVSSDDEAVVSAPEDVASDAEDDTLPALARRRKPRGRRAAQVGPALGSVDSLVPLSTEHRDKFVPLPPYEISAFRRGSKREGIGTTVALSNGSASDIRSEMSVQFVRPEHTDRPSLVRRPTSLTQLTKTETSAAMRSETADKFVCDILSTAATAAREQSVPCKRRTQLRLEGPLLGSSETKSSYVPQDGGARPPLAKRATTLRLEGDLILSPEYRHSFLPPSPIKEPPKKEVPPAPKPSSVEDKPQESVPQPEVKHKEIPIDRDPEYRSSFVDFTRERTQPTTSRPPSRHRKLSTMRGGEEGGTRRRRSEVQRKEEEDDGRFECQPEYRKAYINYLTRENRDRMNRPFGPPGDEPKETIRAAGKPPIRGSGIEKSRDRSVPRTPRQEKVLVPDLSGNTVRRMSSIFGPRPHEAEERTCSPCPIHSGRPRRHSPCGRLARGCLMTDSSSDEQTRRVTYGSSPIGPSFVVLDGGREINNNDTKTTKIYRRPPPWYEPPSI